MALWVISGFSVAGRFNQTGGQIKKLATDEATFSFKV